MGTFRLLQRPPRLFTFSLLLLGTAKLACRSFETADSASSQSTGGRPGGEAGVIEQAAEAGAQSFGGRSGASSTPLQNTGGARAPQLGEAGSSGRAPSLQTGSAGTSDEVGNSGRAAGAGAFGDAGNTNTGRAGDTGEAGVPGTDAGNRSTNGPEDIVTPFCAEGESASAVPELTSGIAATRTWSNEGIQAYAAHPSNQWIGSTFQANPSPPWAPWYCFGTIPFPVSIAAIQLPNNFGELFITTVDGRLFIRHQLENTGWAPWQELNLPWVDSVVRDTAAVVSPSNVPQVFIADRDGIYSRSKSDPNNLYSPYGPWQKLSAKSAMKITAGYHADGALEVFAIDSIGVLSSATGELTQWHDVPSEGAARVLDADCGYSAAGDLMLYAVFDDGTLESRILESNAWSAWHVVDDPTIPKLRTVATVPHDLTLFGVSQEGLIYRRSPGSAWSPMP